MIVIAGKAMAKAGMEAEVIEAIRVMCEASEAEDGCITYQIYQHPEKPTEFFIFEEWENQTALEKHFQTSHMQVFNEVLAKALAGTTQIKRYEVSEVTQL